MYRRKHLHKKASNLFAGFLSVIMIISMLPVRTYAAEETPTSDRIIVSLGDSYSSGEGIEPFYGQNLPIFAKVKNLDWLAHRSKKAWSGMLSLPSLDGTMSDYFDKGNKHWYFAAASGATTEHITAEQKGEQSKKYYKKIAADYYDNTFNLEGYGVLAPQLSVFEELKQEGKKADYVTITIGGNDMGFTEIVIAAFVSSVPFLAPAYLSDKINAAWKNFYKEKGIRENIRSAYGKILDAAGEQAQLLVVGYPQLLNQNGSKVLFSKKAAEDLNKAVSQFNEAIAKIIRDYKRSSKKDNIWFVSVETAFKGHEAYSDNSYIESVCLNKKEDIDDSNPISSYSMHPNEKGACAYAECVQAKIDELEGIVSDSSNDKFNTDLKLSVYDINNSFCNNYKVDITGSYRTGLFGVFKNEYSSHFTVDAAREQSITLNDNGNYVITVTDAEDNTKSYSKSIEVSKKHLNKRIAFMTDFGVLAEETTQHGYKKSDIPDGSVEFNGHYYYLFDVDETAVATWNDAKAYCESEGGYLAAITSQQENDFLYDYICQRGYESAYFGLTDAGSEGTWSWCNGEPVSYVHWASGEPNNEGGENYGMFYWKYPDATWNDGDFGSGTQNGGKAFICEWGEYTTAQEPERTTSGERDIVLVLDVSGSMAGSPMEETKKASVKFIDTILDEDASIGIVTYDDSASMQADFSADKAALEATVSGIYDGGSTNIEAGLAEAEAMLRTSGARKKIIVLMSDGEPNAGKEGDELIAYADSLKEKGIIIYTLGFFESLGGYKSSAQTLMEGIASDGCHYEVASADDLVFFFEDMADQINGQKYIYIRIACPVDVTVAYNGEILSSEEDRLNVRTEFGTLTFEEREDGSSADAEDRIKVLRLKEGAEYDVRINGTGRGLMDYTIGFMDENGEYSDFRRFEKVKITRKTKIDTVAAVSETSVLNIDEDGDGRYDLKLRAEENGYGEEVDNSLLIYAAIGGGALLLVVVLVLVVRGNRKKRKTER